MESLQYLINQKIFLSFGNGNGSGFGLGSGFSKELIKAEG